MMTSLTIAIAVAFCSPDAHDAPLSPAVGAAVPDFTLKDIHRRPVTLAGFKDKKAFVIVFVGTECPQIGRASCRERV